MYWSQVKEKAACSTWLTTVSRVWSFLAMNSSLRLAFLLMVEGALLLLHPKSHCCHSPGVQGKGEGWAHSKREVKFLPFAGQCLAEVHALGDQGGVSFTDCSHFWGLVLKYENVGLAVEHAVFHFHSQFSQSALQWGNPKSNMAGWWANFHKNYIVF